MMSPLLAADRLTLDHAAALMAAFGDAAGEQATKRAERNRDAGDALYSHRGREVARLISAPSLGRAARSLR